MHSYVYVCNVAGTVMTVQVFSIFTPGKTGGGAHISASKHCRKMKFRTHICLTLVRKILILLRLTDFVTCSEGFIIQRGPHLSFEYTQIVNNLTLE